MCCSARLTLSGKLQDIYSGHVLHQVDVYSFSMIAYQLFELTPPFSGMDPVDAARKAALAEERPPLMRLATQMPTMRVCIPLTLHCQKLQQTIRYAKERSCFALVGACRQQSFMVLKAEACQHGSRVAVKS